MKIKKIFLGKENQSASLTTYVLDDSIETLNGKNRPAVIICPGGGFFTCSDREAEPVAMYFASLGYHAFVLRYTTYFSDTLEMSDLLKTLPKKENTIYPKQIRELGEAMLLIRKNASKWHVDTERIGVCGFSAGGHVAALYSTEFNEPVVTDYLGVDKNDLRPAFAILGYAITDYHLLDADLEKKKNNPMDYHFMKASNVVTCGTEIPDKELETKLSPVDHVDSETPPFFIWTTATDPLVNPLHSLELASILAKNNISYEIHVFDRGTHGLSLASQAAAGSKAQISPVVNQWTNLCAKWLENNFALKLPAVSDFEKMKGKN